MNRLQIYYINHLREELALAKGYQNRNQVPKLTKINVSVSLKPINFNTEIVPLILYPLERLTGGKGKLVRSKRSDSDINVRAGIFTAACVTLQGDKIYQFLDNLYSLWLPNISSSSGLSLDSFDSQGNYSFSLPFEAVPEFSAEFGQYQYLSTFEITIQTSSKTNWDAFGLLNGLKIPFQTPTVAEKTSLQSL